MTAARHTAPAREFPLAALPEWLGVYVGDVAQSLQVPADMPAAFALGVMATAAARLGTIRPFGDHVEPLNLFVALVAPPGMKKSACANHFLKAVHAYERELVEQGASERRAAALTRERLEQELETAKRDGSWGVAERLTAELEDTPVPVEPQLTTADVTAQKLASLLAAHGCMSIISAEPSVLPTMLGRWANGKASTELEVFLAGHAGDAIKVDRQGRDSEFIEEPRLSMAIALQPEALRGLAGAETAGRGLLARFLYVIAPDVRGTQRLRDARAIPSAHRRAFEAGLRAMLSASPLQESLQLSDTASQTWELFVDGFEPRLSPGGDMRDLHGWGEKYRGHVARIAGAIHLAEGLTARPVDDDTLKRAICIGQWCEAHALDAFGLMNLRADVREANEILEVVIRSEWDTVSRRQLHQALKGRASFKKARDLERGLNALIERGWFTARRVGEPKAGRPQVVFDVHPEVHFEDFEGLSGGLK